MTLTVFKNTQFLWLAFTILTCFSCGSQTNTSAPLSTGTSNNEQEIPERVPNDKNIIMGADQYEAYLPLFEGKRIGVVANQTSIVSLHSVSHYENGFEETIDLKLHLVDYLKNQEVNIQKVFSPEHGFRGKADAGEVVKDGFDTKTGLPIVSLYGKNKKPSKEQLAGIDLMVFDIQDVGVRFYTYISTMHYMMEACAENNISFVVLDRPNPNGHYIDGPVLDMKYKSFVGMHPVPVVHGMTIGEYAQMINGQKWLKNSVTCDLTVIKMKNYTHQTSYSLPIKPSPNLPNDISINLYPSLCFFESTKISVGRGTEMQFQIFGAPNLSSEEYSFTFTPQANEGAKNPKFKGVLCHGKDLRNTQKLDKLNLEWLIEAYVANGKKEDFFSSFFTKLAGTETLKAQIEQGYTYREIRKTWLKDLKGYDVMRQEYLLYE
ncbi:MAG: DUF1343 domain-containing protein [Flavobacteriaceae bacterium]